MTKTTLPDGTMEYYNAEAQLHRLDGPAVTGPNGYQAWWLNGQLHRADGPAVTGPNGYPEWWLNGQRHRADGPAVIWSDGTQEWWLNGRCHRADGPAVTGPNGYQVWWLNGKRITQAKHAGAVAARFQDRAEIDRLRAEVDTLRSALKLRVSNVSDDQIIAAWAAWDDCHEAPQANDAMRAALEASHLVFLRRTSQIVEAARAAQTGGEG